MDIKTYCFDLCQFSTNAMPEFEKSPSEPTPPTKSSSAQKSVLATPATTLTEGSSNTQSAAAQLEQICIDACTAVNDRDLQYENNDLYKVVTPNFRAHFWNYPHPLTLTEHSQMMAHTIQEYPTYHVAVRSCSSNVDETEGSAVVYMELEITGAPPEVKTYLMNEFKWRRESGVWRCYLHNGMRGVSDWHSEFNLL